MKVQVEAADSTLRATVATKLRLVGIKIVERPFQVPVVVAAAETVGRALRSCPQPYLTGDYRLLVLADDFDPAEVRSALRAGVRAMLSTTSAPEKLASAVWSTNQGESRIPREILLKLLRDRAGGGPDSAPNPSPLTPRQTAVLALMAEGYPNVAIAKNLSCSEHTVKNVIYEMMTRLQVNNRAHAVARAIRAGHI
ncbi:response regulator transcription factor [Salinispora sp. H7-4]|uniref:response regulator transcription factor n=1 Tax=Salinispora sp. H7-4 TaxID=2748321 RepID=UPI0015D25F09|nr:response regulator transcription factor [Salinispora sp. H7-4]NYT94914.1 response regulator transcription factor [Salinispora sp. H7-4]